MLLGTWAFGSPALASAWLIEDQAARDAGVVLEVDGSEIDATLPVELEADLAVAVIDGNRVRVGWVEDGKVYLVHGRSGRMRIARAALDVDLDSMRIVAQESAVRSLAADVGAEVRRAEEGWVLWRLDLLPELSHAPIPEEEIDLQLLPP